MKDLWALRSFIGPYKRWALLAPLAMALEVTFDLLQPRLFQRIVDQGIMRGDFGLVVHSGQWMLLLAALGILAGMACAYCATLAGQGAGADLRAAVFRHVQSLSFGNLDELETGALITRLTNDVVQVQEMVMMLLRVMVRVPLLLVGSIVMAIFTSPLLALLFLPLVPVLLLVLVIIIRKTYPLYSLAGQRLDAVNSVLQENLSGVRVVKAFAHEIGEQQRFETANANLMNTNLTAARLGALTMPLMMVTMNVGVIAALWWGGHLVAQGSLEVGQIIAFTNYLSQTLFSLMMVSMLIMRLSRAQASATRIREVLNTVPRVSGDHSTAAPTQGEPAVKQAVEMAPLEPQRGALCFENVSFSYGGPGSPPVLTDISFTANPGETVAILGATGAGKSTLVQLIPRFYDVTSGRITLDGQDIRDMDLAQLRALVGVALQESILFSGTIRENILFGRPDAGEDAMLAAARAAQAHEFISRLPEGYDTVVGQRGVNLSGGQKQRLAIARALITQPILLVLDDSTSAVDLATEARIQRALVTHHPGQTRLVVAQRISSVQGADQILVLENGRLVAQGTHEELLAASPVYQEIYLSQVESGVLQYGG